jgi:hypothetical protein
VSKGGQGEEGTLDDEMDERVESLFDAFSSHREQRVLCHGVIYGNHLSHQCMPHPSTCIGVKMAESRQLPGSVWMFYVTHEPDKGVVVLPGRVLGKELARSRLRDDCDACDGSEGECGRRREDLVRYFGCVGHRGVSIRCCCCW